MSDLYTRDRIGDIRRKLDANTPIPLSDQNWLLSLVDGTGFREGELARLRSALWRYGRHALGCKILGWSGTVCTCGFDAAREGNG